MNRRPLLIVAAATVLAGSWGVSLAAAPPPNGGTISVDYQTKDNDATRATFVNAADDALAAHGFTILDDAGHAAYAAEITLSRDDVGTESAKVPRGSPSMTTGGGGVGAGISVPFSSGQTKLVPLQRVRLEMRIRKRGEDAVIWSGAAVTVRAAGTRKGADAVVAADLSAALLGSYPTQVPEAVTVP